MHYLDNAATTRPSEAACEALMRCATTAYGNPSSLHALGFEAERELRAARESVAAVLHTAPERIVFTGSGTEATNQALFGLADRRRGSKLVTTDAEHPCVLETLRAIAKQRGFTLCLLHTAGGAPSLEEAAAVIDGDTALVAMMLVNNETGAIFPAREVGELAAAAGAYYHVDAVQAFGKLPFSPEGLRCHTLAVSGHKVGGVKGVGALWVASDLRIPPLIYGGGQERGLRSGTEGMPAIAAFGAAARDYAARYSAENISALREEAVRGLEALGCVVHQPPVVCPCILNFSVPGYRSEPMLHLLSERGVYLSSGSACSSHKKSYSHVLMAMGLPERELQSALRVSFSPDSTREDVAALLEGIKACMQTLVREGPAQKAEGRLPL
ncbi:MAG: cysteine desulfurase [Clostridia bacterium]|nr:cysteine desulfurase [Clostridia bacterium]